jgi:phosphatidylinositol alpha-1,6-mannosyltransferase
MVLAASNRRRILLVTNDLGPRAGGIETFILGLLAQLDGGEIVIYTSSQDGDLEFDQELRDKYGVLVIRDRAKVLLPTPRVTREVIKTLKKFDSEIIWFGAAAPLAWMAPNLKKAGAKKVIALTHGHEVWWAKLFPFNLAMRRIGNSVDVITYLGEYTKMAMAKALGAKPKLVQIAPGIDVEHFKPVMKSNELIEKYGLKNNLVLMCVGRLVHRKGQDKLIQAMPKILESHPNAILVLIGAGPRAKKLEALVAKYKIYSSVLFLGRVSYQELPNHLALADLFIMPSRSRLFGLEVEGLGIVYLEASACGLPVIAGESGGAPDAVQIGRTGFLVDGTSPSEIASVVNQALADLPNLKEMGAKGRTWAEESWSWTIWGKKFSDLLTLN